MNWEEYQQDVTTGAKMLNDQKQKPINRIETQK